MSAARESVKLADVLDPVRRAVAPEVGTTYRQLGVRLWGQGAYEREPIDGSQTKYSALYRVEAGDVVVNKIWARNGSVAVVPPELAGAFVSGEFPTFEVDDQRLDARWMHWITKTRAFWAACDAHSRGTSGKNRIRPEQFLAIEIPLPPLDEQRRMLTRLDRVAELVEDLTQLQTSVAVQLEGLLGAHLNRIFGDPYREAQGTIGSDRLAVLGDVVVDVADGPHKTPAYVEEGVPFVTALNIASGRVSFRTVKYVSETDHRQYEKRARAECGDVLITKDGTIGIPCYVDTDREFSFFVSVALVKPRRDLLDGQYLTWVLRAPYMQARIRERSRGDMIRHLVLREIRALLLPLPELDRQRQIVEHLDAVKAMTDSFRRLHDQRTDQAAALLRGELARSFA